MNRRLEKRWSGCFGLELATFLQLPRAPSRTSGRWSVTDGASSMERGGVDVPVPSDLFLPRFAKQGRLGQGEDHDFLAGHGADVSTAKRQRLRKYPNEINISL